MVLRWSLKPRSLTAAQHVGPTSWGLGFPRRNQVATSLNGGYSRSMARLSKATINSDPGLLRVEDHARCLDRDLGDSDLLNDPEAGVGGGESKLQNLFRQHYHCTPSEWLTRRRIDQAARQLIGSDLALDEIAGGIGYARLDHFEHDFQRRMRLTPSMYRGLIGADEFEIDLPPYFVAEQVLRYLGRDPASETEQVADNTFTFGTHAAGESLAVTVEIRPGRACCRLEGRHAVTRDQAVVVHGQAQRLLGLVIDPRPFEGRLSSEAEVARLVGDRKGLTIPQTATLFDALVWVIAGQQVSLPVAFALRRRLARRVGNRLNDTLYAPPTVQQVAELDSEDLHQSGFSRPKTKYLLAIAREIVAGESPLLDLDQGSATAAEQQLLSVRGLGPWSANYLMMRTLGFVDCVPIGDAALTRNLQRFFDLEVRPDADATRELMKPFAPHRSLATFHLWAWKQEEQ